MENKKYTNIEQLPLVLSVEQLADVLGIGLSSFQNVPKMVSNTGIPRLPARVAGRCGPAWRRKVPRFYPAIISTGGFSGRLPTGYAPADSTVSVSSPGTAVIYFPRRQRFPSFIPAASVRSMQHGTSIL